MFSECFEDEIAGDFVQIKDITRKEKNQSILLRHAIPSGCRILESGVEKNEIKKKTFIDYTPLTFCFHEDVC